MVMVVVVIFVVVWHFEWLLVDREDRRNDPGSNFFMKEHCIRGDE